MLKTDSDGNLISSRRIGGSENDFGLGIAFNEDENEVLVVGRTESNNGDVSGNYGGRDLWVVKLSGGGVGVNDVVYSQNELIVYPNPANDFINIIHPKNFSVQNRISVYDNIGKCVFEFSNTGSSKIDVSRLSPGLYSISFWYSGINEPVVKTIVKE